MFGQAINPLLCSILFMLCCLDCSGQTKDTSFTLLWYKGKKLNDTGVLIPSGQTVTYKPSTGKVEVITSAKQDVLNSLRKELKKSDQRKTELNRLIIGSRRGPLQAGYAVQLNKAMDEVHSSYKSLGENSLELVVENIPGISDKQVPAPILQAYNEVLDFIKEKPTITSSPSPPSMGFDYCYPCDADRQATYKRDSIEFIRWMEEERNNLAKAMKVIGYFGHLKVNKLSFDSSSARKMESEMFNAFQIIIGRLENKLLQAWNQYKGDETKLPFLTQQLFEFLRGQQLMGMSGNPNFPGALQIAATSVEAGLSYLSKAKNEMDYKVLLNIRWIVSLFRTAELLGMDSQKFEQSFLDFIKINQFKVYVDAYGKLSRDGTMLAAKMKGENIFSAIPDSNCVLKWTLLDPDPSQMKFSLEEAIMKTPDVTPVYTGTRNWKSYPANLQLDFCNEEKDTVFLHGFFPLDGKESWKAEGKDVPYATIVNSIYSSCFTDVERMQAMAADPTIQARMEEQLQEHYQKFLAANQGSKDPSKMTPDEIKKMNEAMLASQDVMNIVQSMSTYSFICKDRLRNNQKIIFDAQLNGKELSPDNPAIDEAILKLRIEHVEQ